MKATIIKVYDKTKLIFVVVLRLIIEVRIQSICEKQLGYNSYWKSFWGVHLDVSHRKAQKYHENKKHPFLFLEDDRNIDVSNLTVRRVLSLKSERYENF